MSATLADAVGALRDAISKKDEAAAEELCTEEGWSGQGPVIRGFYKQAEADGWNIEPAGDPQVAEGRGYAPVEIHVPGRPSPVGKAYLHAIERDGAWKLEAAAQEELVAKAFLAGAIPAVFSLYQLPREPGVDEWAEALAAAAGEGKDAFLAAGGGTSGAERDVLESLFAAIAPGAELCVVQSYVLAPKGRAAVELEIIPEGARYGDGHWLYLDLGEGGAITVAGHSTMGSAEEFLRGL